MRPGGCDIPMSQPVNLTNDKALLHYFPSSSNIPFMNNRTISSTTTWLNKFIFPGFLIFGVICLTAALVFPGEIERSALLLVLALTIVLLIPACFYTIPLKKVKITPEGLLISNYLKATIVPFSEIEDVTSIGGFINYDMRPLRIIVTFKNPFEFGDKIMFNPGDWFLFGPHAIIKELKGLAG